MGVNSKLFSPLVAMSERTGMTVSKVTDELLYKGLVKMYELEDL